MGPFILIVLIAVAAFVLYNGNKKKKLEALSRVPPPLDRVRYVRVVYTQPDGRRYTQDYAGEISYVSKIDNRISYSFFIDSSLFVSGRYRKEIALLDANKNAVPVPGNVTTECTGKAEDGCGFVYFYRYAR